MEKINRINRATIYGICPICRQRMEIIEGKAHSTFSYCGKRHDQYYFFEMCERCARSILKLIKMNCEEGKKRNPQTF